MHLIRVATLPSTNDEAVRLARNGAPNGTAVWAEEQTAGRGRRGRSWESSRGNLFLSVVLRPLMPLALAGRLSVACGLGVARAVNHLLGPRCGAEVRTKWPNDLLLGGGKVGGILVDSRGAPGGGLEWAVVGLGLNIVSAPRIITSPGRVAPSVLPSARLADAGCHIGADALAPEMARALLEAGAACASEDGWNALTDAWGRLDAAHGPITVHEDGVAFSAVGLGLEPDGALRIRRGGIVHRVAAGDVSVRPGTMREE